MATATPGPIEGKLGNSVVADYGVAQSIALGNVGQGMMVNRGKVEDTAIMKGRSQGAAQGFECRGFECSLCYLY